MEMHNAAAQDALSAWHWRRSNWHMIVADLQRHNSAPVTLQKIEGLCRFIGKIVAMTCIPYSMTEFERVHHLTSHVFCIIWKRSNGATFCFETTFNAVSVSKHLEWIMKCWKVLSSFATLLDWSMCPAEDMHWYLGASATPSRDDRMLQYGRCVCPQA